MKPIKFLKIFIFSLMPIIGFSCSKPAQIKGKVTDTQDHPIPNASIAIEGTLIKQKTDAAGNYSIDFTPGQFSLVASADGYLYKRIPYNVAQPAVIPSVPIVLIRSPDIPQWKKFLGEDIQKLEGVSVDGGRIARFADIAKIESIDIPSFDQTSENEVVGNVTVAYRAKRPIMGHNDWDLRYVGNLDTMLTSTGRRPNELWQQKFRIHLKFQEPHTWSWISTD